MSFSPFSIASGARSLLLLLALCFSINAKAQFILSATPQTVRPGDLVQINGTGLLAISHLKIGTSDSLADITPVIQTDALIQFFMPEHGLAESGQITAYRNTGQVIASSPFSMTVLPPLAPVISSNLTAEGIQGSSFSYTITAANRATTYGASGMPSGLDLNTSTGEISGTPTVTGTFNIVISATNAGGTGNATLALTVHPPAPIIQMPFASVGIQNQPFNFQVMASNSPNSYQSEQLSTLIPGLSINTSTGVISGNPAVAGTFEISIAVSNGGGSDVETFTFLIHPPAPQITSTLTFEGRTSDAASYTISANNSPTSFGASGLPPGITLNSSTGVMAGVPTQIGLYNVTISATNGGGTGEATLVMHIIPKVPVIGSLLNAKGTNGGTFSYTIIAANSPTNFTATPLPSGLSVNPNNGLITGIPTITGNFDVLIGAHNTGGSDTETLALEIVDAAPVITSALSAAITVGDTFDYTLTAANNPTILSATGLPTGLSFNNEMGTITGMPLTSGQFPVLLTASNATGTDQKTLNLTVREAAPVITSLLEAKGTNTLGMSYSIAATGVITHYTATGLPSGLSINQFSGEVSGAPQVAGVFFVTITANNQDAFDSETLVLTVVDQIPVISGAAAVNAIVAEPFSFRIIASNSPTNYVASGLPSWLGLDNQTGVLSGTPPTTPGASYSLSIGAQNSGGQGSSVLQVTIIELTPSITSPAVLHGAEGSPFSHTITALNRPTSFGATGLPPGLSVNSSTGEIGGTPTTRGTYDNVNLSAANSGGNAVKAVQIIIHRPVPTITSSLSVQATNSLAFQYQIEATNQPETYNASDLPQGLQIDTGTGTITGIPTETGVFMATISAAHSGGTGDAILTINVVDPQPASLLSNKHFNGTNGVLFAQLLMADGTPTGFGADNLPNNLNLDSHTGTLAGLPDQTGVFNSTLHITNLAGVASFPISFFFWSPDQTPPVALTPQQNGDLTICFPSAANDFTIQTSTDISDPMSWQDSMLTPSEDSGALKTTVTPTGPAFFRLIKTPDP